MCAVALHHVEDGDPAASPLVLASSLGATVAMWEPNVAALAARHRVIRFDHRGHGGSPVPDGPYALDDLGADVLALLDRLGLQRVSFCGLSLGGMVGQWLAIHAPERLARLALVCTSAYLPPVSGWHERARAVREAGSAGAVASAVVERWLTPGFREREPEQTERLRSMIAATPPEGYASACLAVAAMDLRPALGTIRAPTLVVAAAQDPSTPPEHGRRIADGIPGARLVVLDDAAHLASWERADAIDALVLEHLSAGTSGPTS